MHARVLGGQESEGLAYELRERWRLDMTARDDADGAARFWLEEAEAHEAAGRGGERLGGRACHRRLLLAKVNSTLDAFSAEHLLGVQSIVGATRDAEVRGIVGAAKGSRFDVIELEERARRATAALLVDVRALLSVASEHLASNRRWNLALPRRT